MFVKPCLLAQIPNRPVPPQYLREAIGFHAIYAIIPAGACSTLESILRERAIKVATRFVNEVPRTMTLEDQAIAKKEREQQIADLADELVADLDKRFWDQD